MKLDSAGFSPDGRHRRARICVIELGATELGQSFDAVPLQRGAAASKAESSVALWESAALIWYLAAKNRERGFVPSDPRAEADTLRWMFFCSREIDPYFAALVVERLLKPRRGSRPDGGLAAEAEGMLARSIPVLERQLAAHDYVAGGFGLADIALGCTFELAAMVDVDLAPFPNIRGWLARLAARESWRKATLSAA